MECHTYMYMSLSLLCNLTCHWYDCSICCICYLNFTLFLTFCVFFCVFFCIATIASSGPILITLIVSLNFVFYKVDHFIVLQLRTYKLHVEFVWRICLFIWKRTVISVPFLFTYKTSGYLLLSQQVQRPWLQGFHCPSQVLGCLFKIVLFPIEVFFINWEWLGLFTD